MKAGMSFFGDTGLGNANPMVLDILYLWFPSFSVLVAHY